MNFAAIKARVNASVLQHLADVSVTIAGEVVPGIFKNPTEVVEMGIGAIDTRPVLTIDSSAVPSDPVGAVVDVDGVPYTIGASDPDGEGLTVLRLERTQ